MKRVAIIGSGPAGLFCADRLADHNEVTIFEAGLPIDQRSCPGADCQCSICHVLEGEGGAGGLSDGKNTYSLTRGTQLETVFHDEEVKGLAQIDSAMVRYAGEGVWYDPLPEPPEAFKKSPLSFESYPLRHVGSDGIRKFVEGFSDHLVTRGVTFRFLSRAMPLFSDDRRKVMGVEINNEWGSTFEGFDYVVIAAGLQGIPWIEKTMNALGSPMFSGPAGFGLRLETDAEVLADLHKQFYDYKIVYEHKPTGIIVRSFCCNQNGYVVNERHTDLGIINVNGHSYLNPSMRTKSSNMAIIAKIPKWIDGYSPQEFVRFQAKKINDAVESHTAYQPIYSFLGLTGSISRNWDGSYMTNHQSKFACIKGLLHWELQAAFASFIIELDRLVPGLISHKSIIYAPEMKYYGRRMNITKRWRCNDVEGLYIIGSGSGYLDSFVAAALSGISAAEDINKEVLDGKA